MAKPASITKLGKGHKWVRMFMIAPPGFGKTVFCGTAPKALYLTTDPEGTISASQFGSDAEEWQIHGWKDLIEAYIWLNREGLESEGYEWVIIDNITEAQRMAMDESMRLSMERSNKKALLDEFIPQIQDYQRSQNMVLQMILKFNDLPVNIIYTSHIMGMEDEEGDPFYTAAIHGQKGALANQIVGYANVTAFGQLIEKEDKSVIRRFWFSKSGGYNGKDRYERLGRFKDNLTVPKMMELLNGTPSKTATKKPATARRRVAKK